MISVFQIIVDCFTKKYFQCKGRSSRKEFLVFTIFTILTISILEVGCYILKDNLYLLSPLMYIHSFIDILYIIPSFTILVRRLHDFKISGWVYFFFNCFIFIVIIYLAVKDGSFTKINRSMSTTTIVFCYSSVILEYLILVFTPGTPTTNKYGEPPIN